jgi:gas vesicle protein
VCSGAMVGTGIALLFSPRSGSQIREQLARSAARVGQLVSTMMEAFTHGREGTSRSDTAALLNRHLARATNVAGAHSDRGLATLGEVAATHLGDGRAAARG